MKNGRVLKSIAYFLLISAFISNSFAGLVQTDSVNILGDLADPAKPGSFLVQVDYQVYDGTDAGDLLGANGLYQAVFTLTHLGAGGTGEAVLNFGRFTVFTGDYTSISAVGTGVTPIWIDPVGTWTDRARYYFDSDAPDYLPTFAEGDVSQQLVLTFDPLDMPQTDIIIEANGAAYNMHADTTITLIPEPATLLLLGSGAVLFRIRRKRNTA